MKRTLFAVAILLGGMLPVGAEVDYSQNPIGSDEYYSAQSMGCMLLSECTAGVKQVKSRQDLVNYYGDYDALPSEFQQILDTLDEVGSKVFIAPEKYFIPGTRGIYHTVSNNFFLNDKFMGKAGVLMSVVRHEGWHAAQDCMAGTINNNFIAVIRNDEDIPELWKEMARRTYPESAVPWEQEATWAGRTEGMTLDALKACATGAPWEVMEPTPLTRQFLIDKGYIE